MIAELTRAMIAEGIARTEKVTCVPGDSRCYVFPDPLKEAQQASIQKDRC